MSTPAGASQQTCTPGRSRFSICKARASERTAHLLAAYADMYGGVMWPSREPTSTSVPASRPRIPGNTARTTLAAPDTFTAITRSNTSTGVSVKVPKAAIPAEWTTRSSWPTAATASSTADWTAVASVRRR